MPNSRSAEKLNALLEGVLDAVAQQPEMDAFRKEWEWLMDAGDAFLQPSVRGRYHDALLDAVRIPYSPLRVLLLRHLEAEATWPDPKRVPLVDGGPPIGVRFEWVIPEDLPIYFAEIDIQRWSQQVRSRIRAVENAAKKARTGLPVSEFAESLRRDGRWLFLVDMGRTTENEIAGSHHRSLPKSHARRKDSAETCDNCRRFVRRRISAARRLLTPTN